MITHLTNQGTTLMADMQAGILQEAESLAADFQGTIEAILIVVGIVVALIVAAKRSWTVGGIIMGVFVGGFIVGLTFFVTRLSGLLESELEASAAVMVHTYLPMLPL